MAVVDEMMDENGEVDEDDDVDYDEDGGLL
jgi:hypothetical protein